MAQAIDILPPVGGLDRRYGFQSQPPYTTPSASNVWARDVLEGRMRCGSCPGLTKAFASGVTGPVHLLSNVRLLEGTATSAPTFYEDSFNVDGVFNPPWRPGTWSPTVGSIQKDDGYAFVTGSAGSPRPDTFLVLDDVNQSTSVIYTIRLEVLNDLLGAGTITPYPGGVYSIFARMNTNSPNLLLNGIHVELDTSIPASPVLKMTSYDSGVATVYNPGPFGGTPLSTPAILELAVTGDMCVASVTAPNASAVINQTIANAGFGRRMGFGIKGFVPSANFAKSRVGFFYVSYTGSAPAANRNVVVAVGGTNAGASSTVELRFEKTPNALTVQTTSLTNPNARQLNAVELLGKLYIVGEEGAASPNGELIWIFDPKDPSSLTAMAAGTPPNSSPRNGFAIAAWRNRLCVVTRDDQQNISFAKAGDPTNWTYGALPVGSACKLNTTGIDTGTVGEPINCLIAHSDDYLIVGCFASLYVLRGDPTYGGQMDRLSSSIGILAPQAYARGPDGETVFLSSDGLYALPAGVLGYPQSVSREQLPRELRDIDVVNNRILMAHDVFHRGVFIGISPIMGGGSGVYFWFDWETKRFWPMSFNSSHEPTALVFRNSDATNERRLLFGCRDGHIRTLNENAFSQDGLDYDAELLIGPIALGGGGYYDGMLLEVVGQMGEGGQDVDCDVQIGTSIENAFHATPRTIGTLRAGKNRTFRPRLRGNACFIRLRGSPPWAMEQLTIVRERLGKQRL